MLNLFTLAVTVLLAPADWRPVSFGPRTAAVVGTRLAVTCFGRIPPVAYQLTEGGVAVRVGGRSVRTACTQAAVNAAMRYRSELPEGTAVQVAANGYLRGVVLSHPTPEGVAELHRLTATTLANARQ